MKFGNKTRFIIFIWVFIAFSVLERKKQTEESSEVTTQNPIAESVFNDSQSIANKIKIIPQNEDYPFIKS
jgi:hypothetical protein